MPDVSFSGIRVSLAEVQEHPARHARALERARITPGHALCHCSGSSPRKLVIRRYGSLFHLAGWPDDGVNHADGCDFRKDPRLAPAGGNDSTAAIQSGPDGLNVRLDASLVQRDAGATTTRTRKTDVAPRPSRRSAPLLAFIGFARETPAFRPGMDSAACEARPSPACRTLSCLNVLTQKRINM